MKETLFSSLLIDLWGDLHDPGLVWQIATLAFCLVAGSVLARLLRSRFSDRLADARMRFMRVGVESFARVLSPLLALGLIAVAKPILAQWHSVNLLRVAIPLVGSFALIRLAFYVLNRAFARGGATASSLQAFEKTFAAVVWTGVALYITGLWPDLVTYLEQTVVPLGRNKVSILTILQASASVLITLMLALWAGALLEERLMRFDTVHSSMRVVLARMGRAVLILIAVLLSLSAVGLDLTVLSVFGGALGVGIGLGLQKIVSNYFSGFVILLERSLAIGDIVTIDKFHGRVTNIKTRYTIIRSGDGTETVVPNEMLVSGLVHNYSLTDRKLRLATRLTVGYQSDIEHVLRLLQRTAAGVARVSPDPAPEGLLLGFGIEGLDLEIAFWIADPENGRSNVLSDVNRAIFQTLKDHRIPVPSSQRAITLTNAQDNDEDENSEIMRATNAS